VYNPYRGFIPKFIYHALHDKPFTVYRGHRRIIDYVEDTVRTFANIVDNFIPGEVYNVGGRSEWEREIKEYSNLEIEIKGRTLPSEIIVISAQYDTLPDSPGANNNGSGIAILFQLTQLLRKHTPDRTLRLLNFVNEEDPFFGTEMMGSYQYAKGCRQRGEDIRVMLSLDALGIYKEEPGSQRLPFPFSVLSKPWEFSGFHW
jgi:Zn-dependent M28 family amino/carboxypeptidase